MVIDSTTAKLPKGQSFILKSSQLAAALDAAGIAIDTALIREPGRIFFDAFYWPPQTIPYERLYVRAGTVHFIEAAAARAFVQAEVMPALTRWLGGILAADPRSPVRHKEQRFLASFKEGKGVIGAAVR